MKSNPFGITPEAQARIAASTCPGCGRSFRGPRGLLSHRTARFQAMGCRP